MEKKSNMYNHNLKKNNPSYYKEGFFTKLKNEEFNSGISEDVIYAISEKRLEPKWMLKFRLSGYHAWRSMKEPHWLKGYYSNLCYNDYSYYSAPICSTHEQASQKKNKIHDLNKSRYLTKEVEKTFNKLGIPIRDEGNVAIDAIFDSVSVSTTFRATLLKKGIIFCSLYDAIHDYPDLVQQYLGTVVSFKDNFFAALNASVVSDGTFIYIPKNVHCPMELSTYFRINSKITGQFERTILIADSGSYVSYIEGCSAPAHDNYQLHAAVVEVILLNDAQVKYSTVQNWFSGNQKYSSKNGILNFVTKRALCTGNNSKMSWIQSESGSAITWKYPSVVLKGKNSIGEFFSVAVTNGLQQADTGTKMIHIGENTKSTILSKGIAIGNSQNTYRGLVKVMSTAKNARNFTQCDSMLIGNKCGSHTFPYIESHNHTAQLEHEATTSKISENQLFYCRQRGLTEDNAISIIINGFCKDIFSELPLEFSAEARKLLEITLEHSVG